MAGVLILLIIECQFFILFLRKKTKLGRKIALYLMKRQGLQRIITMDEINKHLE